MSSNVWNSILARIETKVNRHSFYTWFKPTFFLEDGGQTVTVKVPNDLFRDWLTKHYAGVISEAVDELDRHGTEISFVTADPSPPVAAPTQPPVSAPTLKRPHTIARLNQRYTFSKFVVGPSNQFAHAAARAVAEAPSRSYNPLYIYGGVGLGKTHLMHAIGQYLETHTPQLGLTYISSERFMNEMINAVRYDRILEFRERYRSVDILLVDDIQFLAGKEGTQTEFFHTFNSLYDAQKQIVISSDCPPHEIPSLEERLRSRFEWGLIADIQPPRSRDQGGYSEEKGGSRDGAAARQRRDLYRRQDQVEYPGTRGFLDPINRLRLPDRPPDFVATGTRCAAKHPRSRRSESHDRDHSEIRGQLLFPQTERTQVPQQRQVHCRTPPDRNVSL